MDPSFTLTDNQSGLEASRFVFFLLNVDANLVVSCILRLYFCATFSLFWFVRFVHHPETSAEFYWWLVRITLVVAFGSFPETFGRLARTPIA